MDAARPHPPGVVPIGGGRWQASIWAPEQERVWLHVLSPDERLVPLVRGEAGVHAAVIDSLAPGARYRFRLGEREVADPCSRSQPLGVHGPSEVFDAAREWQDGDFRAPPLGELVIVEIHVGTFSDHGTFAGAAQHLDQLVALGANAIGIMPVAEFPGGRNWGYDGVFPFAVQSSYGGPRGLAELVEACHRRGLAVILDVVHNHLGPEGAVHGQVAPYFLEDVRTPWGPALDFGVPEVRRHFIESALYLARDFHIDGFRVDAIHAIIDRSDPPFLRELTGALHTLDRPVLVIAESDLNQAEVVAAPQANGLGFDAQWSDDFHHAVHALLTGERGGYYRSFGEPRQLARAIANGFVRGSSTTDGVPGQAFVICLQNHDQIGNRAFGERLGALVSEADQRLAAALLFTAPFVPLLFMGQEDGETAPFLYFTSHSDPDLIAGMRRGRAEEFAAFGWDAAALPDPQDLATFERSRPVRRPGRLRETYRRLLQLRRERPALRRLDRDRTRVELVDDCVVMVHRWTDDGDRALLVASFAPAPQSVPLPAGQWAIALDSAERLAGEVAGALAVAPRSAVLLIAAPGR